MNTPTISQDFQDFLDLQTPKVKKNIEVVTPDTWHQDFMLHIDDRIISKFTPMLSRRAAPSEDNTVPRITVAPTLLGCIIGHSSTDTNFHNNPKHGYYINKIPFEYALKVSKKLVFDSDITDECWLVTYDKQTITYKAQQIGKVFITKMVYERSNDKHVTHGTATMLVELEEDMSILFDHDEPLKKGYYEIILNMTNWEDYQVSPITAKQYFDAKSVTAAQLSLEAVDNPLYRHW